MDYNQILSRFDISELNEMQQASLKAIVEPNDVTLISPTGSGKTLAFLLPVLQLLNDKSDEVQVLIIVPSRELALQIEKVFKQMGTKFKINSCYGGHSVRVEENNLQHPPTILVGTPGRIGHHIRRKNLNLKKTHLLILDEFDKSLALGFEEDMSYIFGSLKNIDKNFLSIFLAPKS